jgi:hypothetical protein
MKPAPPVTINERKKPPGKRHLSPGLPGRQHAACPDAAARTFGWLRGLLWRKALISKHIPSYEILFQTLFFGILEARHN